MDTATAMTIMFFAILVLHPFTTFGGDTGINFGRNGDNLPPPINVTDFIKTSTPITLIRIRDDNLQAIEAFDKCSTLVVSVGVSNQLIPQVASSQAAADEWFQAHIATYIPKGVRFRYLSVGNEAISSPQLSGYVLKAMQNLHQSVMKAGINYIQVTTAVGSSVLGASFPPSQGEFAPGVAQVMSDVTNYLYTIGSPLLINIYPAFALAADPSHITLDFALFQSTTPIIDGNYTYYNLFDAMIDAFIAAMVKVVKSEDVNVVISETGWPTAGLGTFSKMEYAKNYTNNLRKHVVDPGCTPRKPSLNMEVYIYEMFNEDLNPAVEWSNFGLFYPNFTKIYPLWF